MSVNACAPAHSPVSVADSDDAAPLSSIVSDLAKKRGRPGTGGRPRKLAKNEPDKNPVEEKSAAVVRALDSLAEDLPVAVRNMLCSAAPHCLTINASERHETQTSTIAMIGEVLSAIEGRLQATVAEKQTPVDAVEPHKSGLDRKLAATKEALAALQQTTSAAKETLEVTKGALREAVDSLKDVEKSEDVFDDVEKTKKNLDTTFNFFVQSKEKGLVKAEVKVLEFAGKKYGFDSTLIGSMGAAFMRDPESRGFFDHTILNQYEQSLKAKIDGVAKELEDGAAAKAERDANIASATAKRDEAKVNLEESSTALEAAIAAEKPSMEEVKLATDAVNAFFKTELREKLEVLKQAQCRYANFNDNVLRSFHDLKDLAPAPVASEPTEEAAKETTESVQPVDLD